MNKILILIIVSFFFKYNSAFAKNLVSYNDMAICHMAVTSKNWETKRELLQFVREAKRRGLDCGIKGSNNTIIADKLETKLKKNKSKRVIDSNLQDCPLSGFKHNCYGKIVYEYSKNKYIGEFQNNKKFGQGKFITPNGDRYIGYWKNNKYDGYGSMYWSDGDKYLGEWKAGKRDGQGKFTYANGIEKEGIWKNNDFVYANKIEKNEKNYTETTKLNAKSEELEKAKSEAEELRKKLVALNKKQNEEKQSKPKIMIAKKPISEFPLKPIPINFPPVSIKRDDIAVIIGNANYEKMGKDIPNVNPAYADAEGIKQYFMKAKGIKEGNIIYLKDATGAQLLGVFGNDKSYKGKLFNYIKPNKSNVYVYYAGHGAPGEEGDAYLVPTDTDSQTIQFTGYQLSTLYSNLGKLPAKSVTVILEACFSGGSQSGSLISRASPIVIQPKRTMIPANVKVIAAGSERQMASWEEDSSHSLFTKYFLKAMSGEGDSNKDGKVSDNELKEYLSDTMTYYARRYYGRDQKVQIHNGG